MLSPQSFGWMSSIIHPQNELTSFLYTITIQFLLLRCHHLRTAKLEQNLWTIQQLLCIEGKRLSPLPCLCQQSQLANLHRNEAFVGLLPTWFCGLVLAWVPVLFTWTLTICWGLLHPDPILTCTDVGHVIQVLQAEILALPSQVAALQNVTVPSPLVWAPEPSLPAHFSGDYKELRGFNQPVPVSFLFLFACVLMPILTLTQDQILDDLGFITCRSGI